jgi:hypothetical protein
MKATSPNPADLIRSAARDAVAALPDFSALPRFADRRTGAELLRRFYFPVSPRSLEVWPLTWRHVNGKAIVSTAELFAVAETRLAAAPPIRGGKRQMQEAA